MRKLFIAVTLAGLLVAGAGCSKKQENPYKNPVPTGGAPSLPTKPTGTPVIPPEAKNVPLPTM